MRVAEDPGAEQRLVLPELRLRVEPAARVVEVDLVLGIEPGVLARPERVDGVGVPLGVLEGGGRPGRHDAGHRGSDGRGDHARIVRGFAIGSGT